MCTMRVVVVSRCARTLHVFRRGLILRAVKEGLDVTAMGADGDGFDRNLREAQIHFEPAPIRFSGLTPLSDLRLIFNLARRFRRARVDVCHAFTIKPAIFATLAARMARVPVRVVTIAKVQWHQGELYPRVGFIVTNLTRPAERVSKTFYNGRGTAEQWIREGKYALSWTRLSCRSFQDNAVRLQLFALAYNLANFLRSLALPDEVAHWSLTTLREKLVKIGARIVRHGRYVVFQLAEVAVPRSLFAEILRRIDRLRDRPRRRRDGTNDVKAEAEGKAMGRSSPDPVDTSRTGALSGLRPFSAARGAAPTGVPIDLHVFAGRPSCREAVPSGESRFNDERSSSLLGFSWVTA